MISIHQSLEENRVHKDWLRPFDHDPSLWLPHQTEALPDDLSTIAQQVAKRCWSVSTFKNGRRLNDCFVKASYFGIDIDHGLSLTEVLQKVKPYACVVGLTRSHQKDKYNDKGVLIATACDRMRVIFRLAETITDARIYAATAEYLISEYGSDPKCVDPARFYFPCTEIVYVGPEDGRDIMPLPLPKKVEEHRSRYTGNTPKKSGAALKMLDFYGFTEGRRHDVIVDAALVLHTHYRDMTEEDIYQYIRSRTSSPDDEIRRIIKDMKGYVKW